MKHRAHFGPYEAIVESGHRRIRYVGNKLFERCEDIGCMSFVEAMNERRFREVLSHPRFRALQTLDNIIFQSVASFFARRGAEWVNLPLTTLMISSPGEVYAGKTLDYTTDTLPVTLDWFDQKRKIFLAESSQFYLEIRLANSDAREVFSIYNSFRKERADVTHLSEFQHIEFEAKISSSENVSLIREMLAYILSSVLRSGEGALATYLTREEISSLGSLAAPDAFVEMPFHDALALLREDTGDERYREFSMRHFGSWEEVRLTHLVGRPIILTHFPLLQIPFYHNEFGTIEGVPVAENADFILPGARETVGAGTRISGIDALAEKARVFNLPPEDYEPYLALRRLSTYEKTSGFGMGWQRYIHWLLKLPAIWEACHFPRGHSLPRP